jgi:glycosyltransferase involved in cell wall biosynthesis
MDQVGPPAVKIGRSSPVGIEHLRLPLVTLFVTSWNYAEYIGALIDSIRAQDYPHFEAIIFDNASEDDSLEVIARHVGDDPRFRVVRGDRNYGQFGAFLRMFDEFKGEFVASLDSDDMLLPDYLSIHIQTHLAVPAPVAFTSSNVFEINGYGALLSGSRINFASFPKNAVEGLRPINLVPRLPTVTDDRYAELAATVINLPLSPLKWRWSPGTSNVYRRQALALGRRPWDASVDSIAIDSVYNAFCHLVGSSALIGVPLSFYRIHDRNDYVGGVGLAGANAGKAGWRSRVVTERQWIVDIVLANTERLAEAMGWERYWAAFEEIAGIAGGSPGAFYNYPKMISLLASNYAVLANVFGSEKTLMELRKLVSAGRLRAILKEAHAGTAPPELEQILSRLESSAAPRPAPSA